MSSSAENFGSLFVLVFRFFKFLAVHATFFVVTYATCCVVETGANFILRITHLGNILPHFAISIIQVLELVISIVAGVFADIKLRAFLRRFFDLDDKAQSDKDHLRGSSLSTAKILSQELVHRYAPDSIPLTEDLKIPHDIETTHFFMIGKPGSGKSQLLYKAIQNILEHDKKAIIYDFKGDMVSKFYDPVKHILLNPLDERGTPWNIFDEIKTPFDVDNIATSFVPLSTTQDPYWTKSAQDVFSAGLHYCITSGHKDYPSLFRVLSLPCQEMLSCFRGVPGAEAAVSHLSNEKTAASILSVLNGYTKILRFLPKAEGGFSLRSWIEDPTDKRKIFLSSFPEIQETIRPLLSLFIDYAGKRFLSLPDDLQRRVFIVIDEFATLQSLPTVVNMLTLGRSKGLSLWLAIQDMGQLEKLYGRENARTIVSSCSTAFLFAVSDPYTADYLSQKIGEREVRQFMESQTVGQTSQQLSAQGSDSTGKTYSYQDKNERVLLPSEIMNIPSLSLYLKLAHHPVISLTLTPQSIPDRHPAFIQRKSITLPSSAPDASERPPAENSPQIPPREIPERDRPTFDL